MTESDLFAPIKEHFEGLGYTVDGEVIDCDILMEKDGEHIAIELKTELNFKLFMQGAKRQKMFDQVYLAVWSPKNMRSKAFKDKIYLLNRLGLGLIVVTKRGKNIVIHADPFIHPVSDYRKSNTRRRKRITNELSSRRTKSNTGGVRGKKILTAYKEDCLIILDLLHDEGPKKASLIKDTTGIKTSYNKVYDNHYGWFVKEGKGIYSLSDKGESAYKENIDTINIIKQTMDNTNKDKETR